MQIKRLLVMLIAILCAISSFGQTIPTVYTDKIDYQPGDVVIIEGDGWRPGEQVKLEIDHSTITHGNTILYATADVNGHIRNEEFIIQSFHLGETFVLTATGLSSGFTAYTTFTDGNAFTATITPGSVNSGTNTSYTLRVSNISDIKGNGAANIRSFAITVPAGWTGITTTGIVTSGNSLSTFVFETSAGFTNGYNNTTRKIQCTTTGNGLPANVSPFPYVEITFTATSPVVTSQTAYAFLTEASDVNNYNFSGNNNIPILKLNGNEQQPFVTVSACAAPSVTAQPEAQTITYGGNTSFTFQTSTATYQWQESTNGGSGWNNISDGGVYAGATTNSLSLTKPPASYNGYQYRCIASNCTPVQTTTSNAVTLTVNKASLTVTADNKNKTYGENNPAFTVSYSGFVGSENATALTTLPTATSTATATTGVGNYAIVPADGVAANYNFIYVNGTLTIGEREITVTADVQSKTYGDSDPALTYQVTSGNLVFNENFTGELVRDAGEDVGPYAIKKGTLALSTNYALTYIGANLTIGQRAITVTADAQNKTYGDSDPQLTYQVTSGNLVFNENFTGDLTRDAGEDVGPYAIQKGTLALSTNYALTYIGANLTIGQRAITVTADAQSKTYGDSDPALTYQVTAGNLVFKGNFTGALIRDAGEDVGPYAIQKGTLALSTNYALTYIGANLTIGQRAITVTADAQSKAYGDSDPALTYQVTSGNLVFNENFTGELIRDAGEDVGPYAIKKGTLALSANYDLTYIGASLTIGQRAITVTADAQNKTYGDSDPALTYQVTAGNLVFNENFTGELIRDAGEDVGPYAIKKGTLALSTNYDLTYIGANLTIGQRAITVTADAQNKTYGDSDPALTYQVTSGNLVFSDAFTGALIRVAGENVSDYAIEQGTLALSANYDLTYIGANLAIGQRAITVTADAQNKTYGDSDPVLTYQVTSGNLVFNENFTGDLTRDAGEDVGPYAIQKGTLALSTNYALTYIGANLTIGQRAITVTANAQSKTYGDSDPAFTYQVTSGNLVFNENFTGELIRDAGEDVGPYGIKKGTLALSTNYALTYIGANLTIGQRAITVTADAQSKTYGDSDPALTYQVTAGNLVFNESFTGDLTRDAGEDVGPYAIQKGTLALSTNYALTYIGANLTIGQRAITVTADAQSKTYGDSDPVLTYQVTSGNLVFNENFTGELIRDGGEDVGPYAIKKGTLALSSNYDLTYIGANLTIGQRAITVTADAQSKTYGDNDPPLTYQVTAGNLVFNENFTGELIRDAGEDVGPYAIKKGTLALSTNYNLSYVGANLTIGKRNLTITVNNKNKLYGAPIPVLDGIETGIVASDNITVSYSTTATAASLIGIYPIMATLNDPNDRLFNYTVSNTPASLTIAVVPVTLITSTNVSTQQYSDTVTFTATINNGAPVVTGANGAAVSVTFKVGNQIMGTVPLTLSGNNLVGVLDDKQLVEGIAGQMIPGAKTVTAIFNSPNANYGLNSYNNTGTCSLMVTKENADITYTGQDYISLPSTTATSLIVSLSATIRDLFPAADGNRGNIKNAKITFRRDHPVYGQILGTANITPALMTDSTTGTVLTSFTYTLSSTEQQSGGANLQVYAVADNYYTGGTSDVATTITIARPGGEFVTGGGYLRNTSCAGVIAGTKDLKTNLGFNMQFNKSGTNLKGQCNIIIRSNGKIYQVKSNAVNTLVVSASTASGTPAYFNTKANYRDITDPLNPISLGGNMDLTVKMNDVSTGGQGDQVSILIMDPTTSQVVFSSNWNGAQTILQNLGGGNVSVRSTPSNNTITSTARESQVEEISMPAVVNPFIVKVYGNPASNHFNMNIKGSAGKICLRVVDIQGRVVEYRENVPEGILQLGQSYNSGFYYLEVRQGNSIRQIKLVKL
jgi:hypothetical protein